MEYLKENFDYKYYIKNNNFINNEFPNKDIAFNHWIYIGIYENLKCNNDEDFLKEIKSTINFIKKLDDTSSEISYNNKRLILIFSLNIKNYFNFNNDFFKKANKIDGNTYEYYIKEGHEKGLIFSKKQLDYYYENLKMENMNNNINILYKNNKYLLSEFCKKFIYEKDIDFFLSKFKILENKLKNSTLCCIFHIGNIVIGLEILNKLKKILKKDHSLIVNINEDLLKEKKISVLLRDIKRYDNYFITSTKDYGNDISPFLIIYNYLIKNQYDFKYLFKIHTKSDNSWRIKLLNCFITNDIDEITSLLNKDIGMIGSNQLLYSKDDSNHSILSKIYGENINNFQFIGGTIFLTCFDYLKNIFNYNIIKPLLLFPYHTSNFLFYNCSLSHTVERIFGFEIYKQKKYIHGLDYSNKNIFILFHVGNVDVFNEMLNDYKDIFQAEYILITTIDIEIKKYIEEKYSNIKNKTILLVENKGMDIGGFLYAINYIKKHNLNNKKYIYIKLHTKSDKNWRNQLIKPIFKNLDLIIKYPRNKSYIFGSKECVIRNKVVNRNYIRDIIHRNNLDIYKFEKFLDIYNYLDIWYENKTLDKLFLNEKFYSYYEYLLNPKEHWENYGINEFHRLSNPCYIKSFGQETYMIAGSLFAFNNKYFELIEPIKFEYEYLILEEDYSVNDVSRKTHAWEYFFSLLPYYDNSTLVSVGNSDLNLKKCTHSTNKIQSIINVPYETSKIAFFLLVPEESTKYSGGYKTLLQYINYLNEYGLSVDIYFGDRWEHMETNERGLNLLEHCNMHELIKFIDDCKVVDTSLNNFYLGLRCQRNYNIVVANAWQTADPAYRNKSVCKNLCYIIQDLEYLFYPDNEDLQKKVKETYNNEYHYYCLSGYLSNNFKQKYDNVYESHLGYNPDNFYDMNLDREDSIILTYYTYKAGRLPKLVESIVKKLCASKIKCYVFPNKFDYDSEYLTFLDSMNLKELNKIYNKCKIGLIFSATNPSRICYEMYGSGLKVIEYDGETTKYDIPVKHFIKIKNDVNIVDIVKELFNDKSKNSDVYKKRVSVDNEKNNVINYFKNILKN